MFEEALNSPTTLRFLDTAASFLTKSVSIVLIAGCDDAWARPIRYIFGDEFRQA
jgi:hypothetical protein